MTEVSGAWWKPVWNRIAWWICLFNTIGSYGFMGYAVLAIPSFVNAEEYAELTKWGAAFSTFWGSCAFWIAGVLQCIEFGSAHPIIF